MGHRVAVLSVLSEPEDPRISPLLDLEDDFF
jgi:hypothetical protein